MDWNAANRSLIAVRQADSSRALLVLRGSSPVDHGPSIRLVRDSADRVDPAAGGLALADRAQVALADPGREDLARLRWCRLQANRHARSVPPDRRAVAAGSSIPRPRKAR